MRRCPVCNKRKKMLVQEEYGGPLVSVPALLYQRSYPGEPRYVSPRCLECFHMAIGESYATRYR